MCSINKFISLSIDSIIISIIPKDKNHNLICRSTIHPRLDEHANISHRWSQRHDNSFKHAQRAKRGNEIRLSGGHRKHTSILLLITRIAQTNSGKRFETTTNQFQTLSPSWKMLPRVFMSWDSFTSYGESCLPPVVFTSYPSQLFSWTLSSG